MQMLNQAMMLKRRVVEICGPRCSIISDLPVALRSHFDEHCQRAGIECIATFPEETLDLDSGAAHAVPRGAGGAHKHARARRAKHIELVIEPEGEGYLMTLGDDGEAMDECRHARSWACAIADGRRRAAGCASGARAGQPDYGLRPAISAV